MCRLRSASTYAGNQEVLVANFNGEAISLRQRIEEGNQALEKFFRLGESFLIEVRKLKEQWPELFFEKIHHAEKLLQFIGRLL